MKEYGEELCELPATACGHAWQAGRSMLRPYGDESGAAGTGCGLVLA